jgi:small subunit ribosomal protein S6
MAYDLTELEYNMSLQNKNLYEGMYILSATLSDDARSKALDKIQKGITGQGGEILKIHEQGRRRLAYDIGGHREGYYYLLYFEVNPDAVNELWQEYHLNEDLVRFMTLRAEKVMDKIEFKLIEDQQ